MSAAPRKDEALVHHALSQAHGWPQEPVDPSPSVADEAWRFFFLFLQRIKQGFPAMAAEFDLSPVQMRVLFELDPETPVPMSALATALSCDASNVTGLVDRLEARGLIERRSDEHDRRVKILAVTRAGAALRERAVRRMAEPPPEIAALGVTAQRDLARLLKRALDAGP
jgi:DNA-binding MarR family transcriptional regulator